MRKDAGLAGVAVGVLPIIASRYALVGVYASSALRKDAGLAMPATGMDAAIEFTTGAAVLTFSATTAATFAFTV